MVKAYDVPADLLIERLASELKKDERMQPPLWASYVKTSPNRERVPQNKEWWFIRAASLLRKVYIHAPIGLSDLASEYGGRRQLGYYIARHKDAGGSIIRKALQRLEVMGYVTKTPKGRALTPEGMKFLDAIAKEIHGELVKSMPELQKYG